MKYTASGELPIVRINRSDIAATATNPPFHVMLCGCGWSYSGSDGDEGERLYREHLEAGCADEEAA